MSFFDDKQEIIKVELTTYGRFLLSRGKFKPVYYAFFDDDILYDAEYNNVLEEQNETQDRILNDTLSLKPQTTFTSIENNVKIHSLLPKEIEELKKEQEQVSSDKNYALSLPIANSSLNEEYLPAWTVNLLNGSISSSNDYIDNSSGLSGSLQPYLKIPQINLQENTYDIRKNINDYNILQDYNIESVIVTPDGEQNIYSVKNAPLVLDISEMNVDNLNKNFDIEIFVEEEEKVLGQEAKKKVFKKLLFKKEAANIIDNILLDEPKTFDVKEDEAMIEYYFELTIDDEIELPPKDTVAGTGASVYQSNVKNGPYGVDC